MREHRWADRAYAALLYLYPPAFRHAYHREMVDCFRDRLRMTEGVRARCVMWLALLADLIRHAAGEWRVRLTGGGALRSLAGDFRFSGRWLVRQPLFSAVTIATLAVGIGATTVVYSVIEAQLLRPLPFGEHGDRLVTLHSTHPSQPQDWEDSRLSFPDLLELRSQARTFEAIEGVITRSVSVRTHDGSERVEAASITPGLFRALDVRPRLGRDFVESDGAPPGLESVAIISDTFWKRALGADAAVVGRTVGVNGRSLTIVGVMPERFGFPRRQEIWLPYRVPLDYGRGRSERNLIGVALLTPGAGLHAARSDAAAVASRLAAAYPDTNRDWSVHVLAVREFFTGSGARRSIAVVFIAVIALLLIACANVGGLLLARGLARGRELGIRTALGASRLRLARLLLSEAVMLAVLGGFIGALLAAWGIELFVAADQEPPALWARPALNRSVLVFTLSIASATALLSGLIPAWRLSRADGSGALVPGSRGATASAASRSAQGALVAGQVGLSLTLVIAAILFGRSTLALQTSNVGFDARGMLSFRVYLAGDAVAQPEARARALRRIVATLGQQPGVLAAGATGAIPADDGGTGVRVQPPGTEGDPQRRIGAQAIPVTDTVFEALGISVAEGRSFSNAEVIDERARVAVINQRLAAVLCPGASAIDRVIAIGDDGSARVRIIGVVPDIVYEELGEETVQSRLIVYVPYATLGWRSMGILLRAAGDPGMLAPAARAAVTAVDPSFATFDMMTMTERRRFTMWGERRLGRLFLAFAGAALLLACLGIYGVADHAAAERTREIGVRVALGASRRDVLWMMLRRTLLLALAGTACGLPLALAAAAILRSLLFTVSAWDLFSWALAPSLLLAAATLAAAVPALRASATDPIVALRTD